MNAQLSPGDTVYRELSNAPKPLRLRLGFKTDPIEYRFSHEWLFQILAEENVHFVQLGTFFEFYDLPDCYFHALREQALGYGIQIHSVFTAHRELGGFFREEPGYERVARANFERLIEIGGLLGATSVGSNAGAVMRDRMQGKRDGVVRYLRHMKELMAYAKGHGLTHLTIEPMSCLAEPPTLPAEIDQFASILSDHHRKNPGTTVAVGYCADVAHGYVDHSGELRFDNLELCRTTLPYLHEVHLKNTDRHFNSTFGFSEQDRARGIVDIADVRQLLLDNTFQLPLREIVGYLELSGPKLGRDYSDALLERDIRESLRFLRQAFCQDDVDPRAVVPKTRLSLPTSQAATNQASVTIAPSVMCADVLNLESEVRQFEQLGVDWLHIDIMDGHFVPNLPVGLAVIEQLSQRTPLELDVHLMVSNCDGFVEFLAGRGARRIAIHLESTPHIDRVLTRIRDIGALAGVAINPATPLSHLEYIVERLDYVLIMTVNPGFAGQQLTPASIRKIRDCRKLLDARRCDIPIQVDGNVSFENIPAMVEAGATSLVLGTSSLFSPSSSRRTNMAIIRRLIAEGLAARFPTAQLPQPNLST